MLKRILVITALFLIVSLFMAVSTVLAQDDGDACPVLVQRALDDLGSNCSVLDRNSACYGFNRVDATFAQVMDAGFFSEPADRAGLESFERIATAPLDVDQNYWGIALLNVQANVPGSLPGQAVVFLLMGDTEVENAVDPDNMYVPTDPVVVKALTDASLHSGPAANTNIVGSIAAGATLQADGLSADAVWLRVISESGPSWINRDALDPLVNMDGLPTITEESRTPMQAFYFRTAFSDLECRQAPSLLALQSPQGIKVDLNVNGADIRMGSRAILRMLPPGNVLEIITIEGSVTLEPGTPNERVIPAGFKVRAVLSDDGTVILTSFSEIEPVGPDELELAEIVNAAYTRLGLFEDNVVQEQVLTVIDTNACTPGQQIAHSVAPGESLFQLSLIYNTSVDAIRLANGIPDTLIVPGQQLFITCGATIPRELPQFGAPPAPPPPAPPVDCGPFRATSPLDGLPYGAATFYWDLAPGATGYRVNISGESGAKSFVTGNQSSLTADLSIDSVGYGFSFTWNVEALLGDAVVCSTPPVTLFREAPIPDAPPPPPTPPATNDPSNPPPDDPPPDNPAVGRMLLTSMCSDVPEEIRVWRVRNPNPFAVSVRWVVYGTQQAGGYTAPPGDSFFTTITVEGPNTTILFWTDENGVQQQDTRASSGARCGQQDGTA